MLLFLAGYLLGGQPEVENFLYVSAGDVADAKQRVTRADIAGVQVVYSWKMLEPAKDRYDFSQIDGDLAFVRAAHKKLFVQVQDRFFSLTAKNVPAYLMADKEYRGGIVMQSDNAGENKPLGSGWVAMQWVPSVRQRYQRLLKAIAERFDGEIYGVNLPETAADIDVKNTAGFTCDNYFQAELENIAFARGVFKKSFVVQYVNFWPCEWSNDHKYMERMFAFAAERGIGLGGPDIVPNQRAQMNNSYPFFQKYKGKLALVAMAVQEATLSYNNPATGRGFTREEFERFGREYLGADIIFWSASAPWLKR